MWTTTRHLLLTLILLALAGRSVPAVASGAVGPSPADVLADVPQALRDQVGDPLFGFVFTMVARDSVGHWTADDLQAFAEAWGEPSVFPLADHLEGLSREPLPDGEVLAHEGVHCRRRWTVHLRPARLEIPMPYSILGYRPGKLSFDTPLVLHEWPVGARDLEVSEDDATRHYQAEGFTVFQIVSGWIILDVDAWLDTLLGKAADDALMQGFVIAWVDGELVGVGNSAGRRGRRILGELDFRSGEVKAHGRPVARGLSADARSWTGGTGKAIRSLWLRYDG